TCHLKDASPTPEKPYDPIRMTSLEHELVETDALALLDRLCGEPSVSAEGRALETTAELVRELLESVGFHTKLLHVDGAPPAVYGELRGRGDYTLLLYTTTTSSRSIRSSSGSRRRSS